MEAYKCEFYRSNLKFETDSCYVFAESHSEAANIFEEKKYWQWILKDISLCGKAFDKNSEKEED